MIVVCKNRFFAHQQYYFAVYAQHLYIALFWLIIIAIYYVLAR